MRRPGVEPGSTAWKATMLTVTPPTLYVKLINVLVISSQNKVTFLKFTFRIIDILHVSEYHGNANKKL